MSKKMILVFSALSFVLLLAGGVVYYFLPKSENIAENVKNAGAETVDSITLSFSQDIFDKPENLVYEYIQSTYNPPASSGAASVIGRVYFVKSKIGSCDTQYMSTMIGRHANRSLVGKDPSYYNGAKFKNPYEVYLLIDKFHKGEMSEVEKEEFKNSYSKIVEFNNDLTKSVLKLYNIDGVTCKLSKEDIFMELLVLG